MPAAVPALERLRALDDDSVVITMLDDRVVGARAARLKSEGPQDRPLWGVPTLVKDNIAVAGVRTTAACPEYATTPATRSAGAVERLEEAGYPRAHE